jgi:spore maturation protein CgeB
LYDAAMVEVGGNGELGVESGDGEPRQFRKMLSREQSIELAANNILSTCFQWWPDVVLCVSAFFMPLPLLDIIRARRMKVVLLFTESPYQDEEQVGASEHADLVITNDPTNMERFRAVCPETYYLPHAYRPSLHRPGPAVDDLVCDLGFVGTAFESRIKFFEAMDLDGLDVLLGGNWRLLAEDSKLRKYLADDQNVCLSNEQTVEVYRSMRVGLNYYRREIHYDDKEDAEIGEAWAMGPREVEMAACRSFFLRDPRAEGDAVLSMLPTFSSPEEASALLRDWLDRPNLRQNLAWQARAAIVDRTFEQNAKQFLRWMEKL